MTCNVRWFSIQHLELLNDSSFQHLLAGHCVSFVFDMSSYHKGADAPLRRLPFKAAVDVVACVDEEHDAASDSVEVTQQ